MNDLDRAKKLLDQFARKAALSSAGSPERIAANAARLALINWAITSGYSAELIEWSQTRTKVYEDAAHGLMKRYQVSTIEEAVEARRVKVEATK